MKKKKIDTSWWNADDNQILYDTKKSVVFRNTENTLKYLGYEKTEDGSYEGIEDGTIIPADELQNFAMVYHKHDIHIRWGQWCIDRLTPIKNFWDVAEAFVKENKRYKGASLSYDMGVVIASFGKINLEIEKEQVKCIYKPDISKTVLEITYLHFEYLPEPIGHIKYQIRNFKQQFKNILEDVDDE